MKKTLMLFLLILAPKLWGQTHYVYFDTVTVTLNGIVSDTVWVTFPSGPGGWIELKNTASAPKPPRRAAVTGYFQLWVVSRTNVAGTADSLTLRTHPRDPLNGALSKNDSTYKIGSAALTGSPSAPTNFGLVLNAGTGGVGIVLNQADTSVDTTRLVLGVEYTSQ